jgi:hypothetical protein
MSETRPIVEILVTCVGGRLIFDSLHALRQAPGFEARISGVDASPDAHGRLLCDSFHVLPHAGDDPGGFRQAAVELVRSNNIQVLLVLSDDETSALADARVDLIELGAVPSFGPAHSVNRMTDKLLMLQAADAAGASVGEYHQIECKADLQAALAELGYPGRKVVLKPRTASGSRGVIILDADRSGWEALLPNRFCGTADLDNALAMLEKEGMSLSGQIAVPWTGGPVFDVDCIAREGVLLDYSARRRQLANPLWPTSTGHVIDLDARVRDMAEALCAALDVHGAGDFDIALNEDGVAVPFDAAPRFSGSVGGTVTAGGNFPAQLVQRLLDLPTANMVVRDGTVLRPYLTMAEIPTANQHDYL